MIFAIIMIDVSKYDKLLEDIKSMLFSERKSRKLNKIEPNFYKNIYSLFVDLNAEKERVVSTDITEYMEITKLLDDARKNFKAFFQVRFEKIAKYSVYDEIEEFIYNMSPEEKGIMRDLNEQMKNYYKDFIGAAKPEGGEKEEEAITIVDKESPEEKPEPEMVNTDITEEPVPVRILKDQPPIAQPERDYYLHKNDIIYISPPFARILNNHSACVYIEKGKKL